MICIQFFMISHHLDQSITNKKFSPMRQDFTYSFTVLWSEQYMAMTKHGLQMTNVFFALLFCGKKKQTIN